MTKPGQIIVLNGAPRSGKSSVAAAILETFAGVWINLGVDGQLNALAPHFHPGIGLRPGGERPDLENVIPALYSALYESVAAHSRLGLNVAVDVGHHESFSKPLKIMADCARGIEGLPTLFVGVRCPVEVIMQRRDRGGEKADSGYLTSLPDGSVPEPVLLWQSEAHRLWEYDLEVDTSLLTAQECAKAISAHLAESAPALSAFRHLARGA